MSAAIIKEYEAHQQPYFEQLNKAWLNKYFRIEPVDEYVLTNPGEAILSKGGSILVAMLDDAVVGVVALRKLDSTIYEFTKMAVDEKHHRKGIAEKLGIAAIEKVKQLGGHSIILYSHSSLLPALTLYQKLGFTYVPMDMGNDYERSNVKMVLPL